MIQLEIFGRPVPCNSHHRVGKRFYNPKYKELQQAKWQVKSQFNRPPITGPTELKAIFFFKVPKNTSYVKKQQMLANIIKHTSRPDRGNLEKFLEDVLEGIVIDDDSKFWKAHVEKRWCESEKDEKTLICLLESAQDQFHTS